MLVMRVKFILLNTIQHAWKVHRPMLSIKQLKRPMKSIKMLKTKCMLAYFALSEGLTV